MTNYERMSELLEATKEGSVADKDEKETEAIVYLTEKEILKGIEKGTIISLSRERLESVTDDLKHYEEIKGRLEEREDDEKP